LVLLLAGVAWSQVTGSISGKVQDATSAPVAGATVTVKSLETGATRTAMTDEGGNFRILSLPLGAQEVKAEKTGFKATVRTGVNLEVGQEAVVNLQLEVGELAQQVAVSAEAPVVNTTTAAVSGVVNEREVKDLPLNGRSFDNLIALNPGAVNYSAMKSPQTSTSNGNTFSVDGRRTYENLFLLNGIEYTGSSQLGVTPGGASGELLGIDAIREFNVLSNTYDAEYGKRAGAQIQVVTQSGTNELHGTLFEFLRNSDLDARNFFDLGFVPPFRRNQFGGALGGPLKKDRLFLFGNYEGFRQSLAVTDVSIVPDQLARQGLLPNGSPVPNLNRAMLPYMSFWPAPNGAELPPVSSQPGAAFNNSNPKETLRDDFGTLRSDYIIRDRDTLSVAYTIDDGSSLIPLTDPLFGSVEPVRSQVASIEETHIISPHVLNNFTAGFSRASYNLNSYLYTSFPSNLSFVSGAGPGGIVIGGGVTTSSSGGTIASAGPNNAAGAWNRRNLFTYTDDVRIVHGIHQISAGIWLQRVQDNDDTASRQLGQATFSTLATFLQGTVSSFQVVPNANELGWRSLFGAWYVEDTMKLSSNLTLQVGLRHEFTTGWNEESGRAANYITSNGVLVTNPIVGSSVFTVNNATKLFSPRIGLAWDVLGNGKTAVRAGFGTYYSLIDDLSFLLNSLPPYNGSAAFSGSLFSFTPIFANTPVPPSCGPGVPTPCTTYAPQGVQPNAKTPTVEEWNFSVEQQLDRNTVLRVAYVGSFGYHGFVSLDPNTIPAQVCASASGCTAGGVGTARSTVPQEAQYIPVGSRPNPYLSAGLFWYTEGNTSYNALQLDVTRRFSGGFQFRANYTWSKDLDMNSALTIAQANNEPQVALDRNDLHRDWGPSALNIANQASLSGSYELPFGRGKPWLAGASGVEDKLVSGWQLNAITTLLSGFPFTPQIGANTSGDGDTRTPDRPSLNPAFTGPVVLGNPNQWFNPQAFMLPPAGTYGNLGRGIFDGPGLAELDLSLFKTTALSEQTRLQFRAEFFNALNHTNLGTPKATVFSGSAISSSAGVITTTATTSRQIQFGLKLIF